MYPKLLNAQYLEGYKVKLSFSDGSEGAVDLSGELGEGVFEALRDLSYFRSFRVQQQFGTIEWENGADFAPEYLYELTKRSGQQTAGFDARSRSRKSA